MTSTFGHDPALRQAFPALIAGTLLVEDVDTMPRPSQAIEALDAEARQLLAHHSEGELPPIRAWRRAFSQMGLKPTQYRCASEALLRRFRKYNQLPQPHPLVDLCNAASIATAIPIAVFDRAAIGSDLLVRYADGDEDYLSFTGEHETPVAGEVIFADAIGRAHARRWTNRQSAWSATQPHTRSALIVAEALHDTAHTDVSSLLERLTAALPGQSPHRHLLSAERPALNW